MSTEKKTSLTARAACRIHCFSLSPAGAACLGSAVATGFGAMVCSCGLVGGNDKVAEAGNDGVWTKDCEAWTDIFISTYADAIGHSVVSMRFNLVTSYTAWKQSTN